MSTSNRKTAAEKKAEQEAAAAAAAEEAKTADGVEGPLEPIEGAADGTVTLLEAAPAVEVHVVLLTTDVAREFIEGNLERAKAAGNADAEEQARVALADLDELSAAARERIAGLGDALPVDARLVLQAATGVASPPAEAPSPTAGENVHHDDWQTDAALEAVASHDQNNPAGETPATDDPEV